MRSQIFVAAALALAAIGCALEPESAPEPPPAPVASPIRSLPPATSTFADASGRPPPAGAEVIDATPLQTRRPEPSAPRIDSTPATPSPSQPVMTASRRVALVIGNGGYRNASQLANTRRDAEAVASALRAQGFELLGNGANLDLNAQQMRALIQSFGRSLNRDAVGAFYYAGHGVQISGQNYLVPIDASPANEADAAIELVDASIVISQMETSGAKLKIVMLDACRNNPFASSIFREQTRGLVPMYGGQSTIISYATRPLAVARDGPQGGNSPYATALAQAMGRRGVDVKDMFNRVGLDVLDATNNQQEPWLHHSPLRERFFIAGQ